LPSSCKFISLKLVHWTFKMQELKNKTTPRVPKRNQDHRIAKKVAKYFSFYLIRLVFVQKDDDQSVSSSKKVDLVEFPHKKCRV